MLEYFERIDYCKDEIPSVCFVLEDCWNVAIISIAHKYGVNFIPIFVDNVFFYQKCIKQINFTTMVLGTYLHDISTDNRILLWEYDFCKEFLGLKCENITMDYKSIQTDLSLGGDYIIWCDTYKCPWNSMYQKSHYPHCFYLSNIDREYCEVTDPSIIDYKIRCKINDIYHICTQITFVQSVNGLGTIKISSDILKKLNTKIIFDKISIAEYNQKNIEEFANDFKSVNEQISKIDLLDENIVKLLIRFLKSNSQKCTFFHEYYVFYEYKDIQDIDFQVGMRWRTIANLFMKLYYSNASKRNSILKKIDNQLDEVVYLSREKTKIVMDKGR